MVDCKVENCRGKLANFSKDEALGIIYAWVKQDFISLKQFKQLFAHLD